MSRISHVLVLLFAFSVVNVAGGCKPAEGEKKSSGSKDATPKPNPSPKVGGDDASKKGSSNCKTSPTKTNTSTTDSGSTDGNNMDTTNLDLTGDVSYDSTIKSILDNKCGGSCHSAGKTLPDLSTYDRAKAAASSIQAAVSGGRMPKSGSPSLTDTEKSEIATWVSNGAPESSGSSSDSTNGSSDCDTTSQDNTSSGSSDGGSTPGDEDNKDIVDELLHPAKLKECHDQDLLYDRGKDKCNQASIAKSYECTLDGITKKFKSVGVTLTVAGGVIQGFTDYEIDQCGEFQGDPVIFFMKAPEPTATGDDLKVSIKILCKKGSAACER